jgi:hypothetical protein
MMVACVKIAVTRLQNISICSCIEMNTFKTVFLNFVISNVESINIVPHTRHQGACDPREGTWGYGIIRCWKPGILVKIELRISHQRSIRFLPETDYPRASRSFPRIAGSGNEIVFIHKWLLADTISYRYMWNHHPKNHYDIYS